MTSPAESYGEVNEESGVLSLVRGGWDLSNPDIQEYIAQTTVAYIRENGGIERSIYTMQIKENEVLRKLSEYSPELIIRALQEMFKGSSLLPQSFSRQGALIGSASSTDIIELKRSKRDEPVPPEVFALLGQLMDVLFSKTLLYIPQQVASRMRLETWPYDVGIIEGLSRDVMRSSPLMLTDGASSSEAIISVASPTLTGEALQRETQVAAVAVEFALKENDGRTLIQKGLVAKLKRFWNKLTQ